MLSLIIWLLIWFFLIVGVASFAIAIIIFFMNDKATPALWFSQICGVCFIITLVACIAAKGVGL